MVVPTIVVQYKGKYFWTGADILLIVINTICNLKKKKEERKRKKKKSEPIRIMLVM